MVQAVKLSLRYIFVGKGDPQPGRWRMLLNHCIGTALYRVSATGGVMLGSLLLSDENRYIDLGIIILPCARL